MLIVHRSNRAERLVDMLGDVLAEHPPEPFESEPVIVQGRGMERWLSMRLAERFGVWAHPRFPFPRRFLLDLFADNLPIDQAELAAFEPEALTWSIAGVLPELIDGAEMEPLRRYLGTGLEPARLIALAQRIASVFDDYVVFRWEMVSAWERGAEGGWEAILWRRLVAELGEQHIAARAARFRDRLRGKTDLALPGRVSLFGVSTLAPLYLEIFAALAETIDVHLFVLSPSREYWAGLRQRRTAIRGWLAEQGDAGTGAMDVDEVLERESGNRLLSSLGRMGGEFQAILEGIADYVEQERYEDPLPEGERATALRVLQADMLSLRYRSAAGGDQPARVDDDRSIAIHSCHGPMREVQVLHDQLRARFADDPTLRPRDVIVMTPSIESYAAYVEAVFDSADGSRAIPFRIADRGPDATSGVFDAFAELLSVLQGRLSSAEVVDLLRLDLVRRAVGFEESDIDLVRDWVDESGVRWGIDAADRAAHGQPEVEQNTWTFGLRRLYLGLATGEVALEAATPYAPCDDLEGSDASVLGALAELCRRLFAHARRLRAGVRLAEWPDFAGRLVDDLLWQEAGAAFEVQALRSALAAIAERGLRGDYRDVVDAPTMLSMLDAELRMRAPSRGFLGGEVTFCELVPMRTIPFRVVCLIGMNDGDFPRNQHRSDFDRIGQQRRWGDRSLRDDDRYLFLEALLSARETFYISYVGQDAQSNTDQPPSVVVQELIDSICDSFIGVEPTDLVVRHKMQAFHPSYFRPGGLPSYSRPAYEGAQALLDERVGAPDFVPAGAVVEDRGEPLVVSIDELVRFFEHPTRAFLQRRLQLFLGGDIESLDIHDPLALDPLAKWQLGDTILRRSLRGQPVDFATMSRLGTLPIASLGEAVHEEVATIASAIAAAAPRVSSIEAVAIDRAIGSGVVVRGVLRPTGTGELTAYQYSRLGQRQEIGLWLRHLLLAAELGEASVCSRLYGRGATGPAVVSFGRVGGVEGSLAEFALLYREGMQRPLPLLRNASREYAKRIAAGTPAEAARSRADQVFAGEMGDVTDAYVRQVYGDRSPFARGGELGARAEEVALAVYRELLSARQEVPL